MTYLEGTLEIMSPGRRHEQVKKLLARLDRAHAAGARSGTGPEGGTPLTPERRLG
jgi:hypothetical protein